MHKSYRLSYLVRFKWLTQNGKLIFQSSRQGMVSHIELWGWETFFSELGRFLESSGRNFSTANEAYATYVLERLEVCIISLNAIKLNLQQLRTGSLTVYRDHVEQILSICRTLN